MANKRLAAEKTIKSKKQKKREREEAARQLSDDEDEGSVKSSGGADKNLPMKTRARLQELGPRFTLKLKWLQEGVLDTEFGEYEWIMGKKNQMKKEKKKFYI